MTASPLAVGTPVVARLQQTVVVRPQETVVVHLQQTEVQTHKGSLHRQTSARPLTFQKVNGSAFQQLTEAQSDLVAHVDR